MLIDLSSKWTLSWIGLFYNNGKILNSYEHCEHTKTFISKVNKAKLSYLECSTWIIIPTLQTLGCSVKGINKTCSRHAWSIIWEDKDLVAKMELLEHISDVQGEAVRKLQTSHRISEKLKSQYKPKTDVAHMMHTLCAYVTVTMK